MKLHSTVRFALLIGFVSFFLLTGCATMKTAPLSDEIDSIDISKESIGFFTVKASNDIYKDVQPKLSHMFIWEDKPDKGEKYSFDIVPPYNKVENECNEHFVSFQLKPGDYIIQQLSGTASKFIFSGTFWIPLSEKISIPENKILYFGHVEAKMVERTSDDQIPAGPFVPLLDQAASGISKGTFIVDIQNRYDADTALLKEKYPYLKDSIIEDRTFTPRKKSNVAEMK